MTASRKAERLSGGWVCLDRRQGEPACTRMPETGENPVKMAFSNFPLILRFREVLGVSYYGEKQEKLDCFFLLIYSKKNNAKKTTLGNIHEVNIFCKLRKEVVTHKTQMYFL